MPRIPPLSNQLTKQLFLLCLVVGMGYMLFTNLYEFLPALLGAVTIYILTRKLYFYCVTKLRWSESLTAINIIVASMLIIVYPITLLVNMLTVKLSSVFNNSSQLIAGINTIGQKIKDATGYDILSTQMVSKLQTFGTTLAPKILGATINTFTGIIFLFFILYFLLVNGKYLESLFYKYMPLKKQNILRVHLEVQNMVISNAIGIPVIAFLQSIVALIGYYIFGVQDPLFWFVVTCFAALIPIVGSSIILIPLAAQIMVQGNQWQGIGLIIWGIVAVGLADNVFRILLSKKIGDAHPLITIFGVIVGVKIFGFIGLVFGPLLISMFILLIKIYTDEYLTTPKSNT